MNKLKNLNTGEILKRLYHDEELSQTFTQPEVPEVVKKRVKEKPKLRRKKQWQKDEKNVSLKNLFVSIYKHCK
jgi:hypothetical protein